jgi:AhpD family alkylhydroperoxidase
MTTTQSTNSQTARVPLEHPGSKLAGVLNFWTRRTYGQEMEPMLALLHNRKVTMSVARFEMGVAKWAKLDSFLKELACLALATQIGCSSCMDFGYCEAHERHGGGQARTGRQAGEARGGMKSARPAT